MRKAISLFLTVCLLTLTLTACTDSQPTDEELVEKSVKHFLHTFNEGTADEMLACFSSDAQERFADNLLSGAADAAWVAIAISLGVENVGDTAQLTDITVAVYQKDMANAAAKLSYSGENGNYTGQVLFEMVKEKGSWYVENYEALE